jgi:hypothetical protein
MNLNDKSVVFNLQALSRINKQIKSLILILKLKLRL